MDSDFQARLAGCRDLPSPPGVALRILEIAQDPDVSLDTAADAIGMDVALSARILRIANSPLYANRRRVETLNQALTLLGLNATLTLALGFSLTTGLRSTGPADDAEEFTWRRSVVSALASRLLGQALGLHKLEELMMGGLLQDIGALVLLQIESGRYRELLRQLDPADHAARLRAERERFGCDHVEVGRWIAAQWNLPPLLQSAIGESEAAAPSSLFMACVAASGHIADLWLLDDTDAAYARALAAVSERLPLDAAALDGIVQQVMLTLPEISAMFDVRIAQPERIGALLAQARELLVLRNLIEIQNAARARLDADESEHRMRQLAEEARRDPLTGVYNRSKLEQVLAHEFDAAVRNGSSLSVAFIDLDDFKKINDQWGHQVGDQVLRRFATCLQGHLRSTDVVARYGGEEFLIVLPNTPDRAALAVVRRILEEVASVPMANVDGTPLFITFSAGLATQGELERFECAEQLLRAADEALYGAKRDGRNRIATGLVG